jgi:Domain of unknown function (DUF1707)
MASNTRTRASDADRDRTAAALREHLAAGRLTIEEFDERLDKAYAAKTPGELDQIMTDLPATDPDQVPDAPVERPSASLPPGSRCPPGSIQAGQGRFNPGVAGGLGVLARDQSGLVRDLAGQRRQRRPVVLVGGAGAGRRAPGPLAGGHACPSRTPVRPAAAAPQIPRRRPSPAVAATAPRPAALAGPSGKGLMRQR